MPLGTWLKGDLKSLVSSGTGRLADLIDPSYTQAVASAHLSGSANETSKVHSLLFLEHWLEQWQ
jgi:hypothetical protein